jgi:hypothetical protein
MIDFLKSIENAHKLPEDGSSPIPDVFSNPQFHERLVDKVPAGTEDAIAGATRYNFEFRCARLVIGKEQVDFANGQAIYESSDDSERLSEIMNDSLLGRAIINKRLETFLKDGTIVLWLEWLVPIIPPIGAKKGDVLTTEELLSPEPRSSESKELPNFSATESD